MAVIAPGEKEPQEMRPYFDPLITLGNVLTIIGGLATVVTFIIYISLTVGSRLDRIEDAVNGIRCTLAYAGIAPTFTPSGTCAAALDTSTGTLWYYYSGSWH